MEEEKKKKFPVPVLTVVLLAIFGVMAFLVVKGNFTGKNIIGQIAQEAGKKAGSAATDEVREETGGSETEKAEAITLEITSPEDGAILTSSGVTVKGKTVPNAEVFVDDKETKADANGNFSVVLTIEEGENTIVVTANDSDGSYAEKEVKVTLE